MVASAQFTITAGANSYLSCNVNYGDDPYHQGGVIDGNLCTGAQHTYSTPGLYRITFFVFSSHYITGTNGINYRVEPVSTLGGRFASTRRTERLSWSGTWTSAATTSSGQTVAVTYYRVDGGPAQVYTAPFTVLDSGTHTVQYRSVDTQGVAKSVKTVTITVADSGLRITTEPPLPSGLVDQPYSAQLAADGGIPPYIWSIVIGSLPLGLGIDENSGLISGTPVAAGSYGFTVQVRDSMQAIATKALALAPPPPSGLTGTVRRGACHN